MPRQFVLRVIRKMCGNQGDGVFVSASAVGLLASAPVIFTGKWNPKFSQMGSWA
jgi:hypothetical protein